MLSGLGHMTELPAHHANAADDTVDNRVIDHAPQPRSVLARQYILPGEADLHPALDLLTIEFPKPVSEDLPREICGRLRPVSIRKMVEVDHSS